jgi:hypothetical protein
MNMAVEWGEASAFCVWSPVHWAFNGATPAKDITGFLQDNFQTFTRH